jgi:Fur family transcriptional regulator, zinc uptake regulator
MDMTSRSKIKSISTTKKKLISKPDNIGANTNTVQKILATADKPLSAYDIIPLMSQKIGHTVAPVTVYRALQHLIEQGLVTRIESRNAYVLCQHPHEHHDCMFFICRECGIATEASDSKVSRWLRKEAEELGFGINKQILEIIGLCQNCSVKNATS